MYLPAFREIICAHISEIIFDAASEDNDCQHVENQLCQHWGNYSCEHVEHVSCQRVETICLSANNNFLCILKGCRCF